MKPPKTILSQSSFSMESHFMKADASQKRTAPPISRTAVMESAVMSAGMSAFVTETFKPQNNAATSIQACPAINPPVLTGDFSPPEGVAVGFCADEVVSEGGLPMAFCTIEFVSLAI